MPTKYLYGASIDGIQPFIFETNKLKEIVGGSELVEQICKEQFETICPSEERTLIMSAAGKIVCLFDKETDCAEVVKIFPKELSNQSPNIKFSQTVIEIPSGEPNKKDFDRLDANLEIQKNKKAVSLGLGLMISERSRRTGKPAIEKRKVEVDGEEIYLDKNQHVRYNIVEAITERGNVSGAFASLLEGTNYSFPVDLELIAKTGNNEWLAIVHADGNSLGQTVAKMFISADVQESAGDILQEFSHQLDEATRAAAKYAIDKLIEQHKEKWDKREAKNGKKPIPIRPIILGGDDLTFILRGDLAIDFTHHYLKQFQINTKANFQNLAQNHNIDRLSNGVSACAGIAYIKPNYPFHYGVKLADNLTKYAKDIAKNQLDKYNLGKKYPSTLIPACLAFHKVQSSFVENYQDDIIPKELTAKEADIAFNFGPYFVNKQPNTRYETIQQLKNWVQEIKRKNAPAAGLRRYLSELHEDEHQAELLLKRIIAMNPKYVKSLNLDAPLKGKKIIHFYDLLNLASIEK